MTPDQAQDLKQLLQQQDLAALGTLHRGEPFVSMVPYALLADGRLRLDYEYGAASGCLVLDGQTLRPYAEVPVPRAYPPEVDGPPQFVYPGIGVHLADDRGSARDGRYVLRWEEIGRASCRERVL